MYWDEFSAAYSPLGYDALLNEIKNQKTLRGLSYRDLSIKYKIPVRTLQNWLQGKSDAPAYVLLMLLYCLNDGSYTFTI